MSRIGKRILSIPQGVDVSITETSFSARGPKGEVARAVHPLVRIEKIDGTIKVTVAHPENKKERSLWGLYGSLAASVLIGASAGFSKKLEINGTGYRAAVKGKNLELEVGFSHKVLFPIPEGITIVVEKNVVAVSGADKYLVGEVSAQIRAIKKPEPYQGKGIKYVNEKIRRKAGKTAKTAAAA